METIGADDPIGSRNRSMNYDFFCQMCSCLTEMYEMKFVLVFLEFFKNIPLHVKSGYKNSGCRWLDAELKASRQTTTPQLMPHPGYTCIFFFLSS